MKKRTIEIGEYSLIVIDEIATMSIGQITKPNGRSSMPKITGYKLRILLKSGIITESSKIDFDSAKELYRNIQSNI